MHFGDPAMRPLYSIAVFLHSLKHSLANDSTLVFHHFEFEFIIMRFPCANRTHAMTLLQLFRQVQAGRAIMRVLASEMLNSRKSIAGVAYSQQIMEIVKFVFL